MGDLAQINNRFYEDLGERWYDDDRHAIALLRAETKTRVAYIEQVLRDKGLGASRILDLGCGAGLITIPLAHKGHDIKGVDISENSLAVARKRMSREMKVSFAHGDVTQLNEEPETYDAVLMMDLLEHLENQQAAVFEASRVLRPGGILLFHTFNRTLLSYLVAIKGIGVVCRHSPQNLHVYHLFIKPKELRQMCARAGLTLCEMVGIRPRFFTKAFWRTLLTHRVDPEFEFTRTRSLLVGYLGYAIKAKTG